MLPLQEFINYIEENVLFTKKDKILLAVSGGKDSALMVQLFIRSGYTFSIAHCNFNLRAQESDRDEAFVKSLATEAKVPFYVQHFDTKAYASANGLSTQMAARDLRYEWFEKIRKEGGYTRIALAHHQNDSIETLLLNLTRGTGISGMHGILPKRDKLVRPLLFLSSAQIEGLILQNEIAFVEDSSNQSSNYARNQIRLNVIPQLKALNPNLENTFAQNINRFAETEEVLHAFVAQTRAAICREVKDEVYIDIESIKKLKPQKLLFFELLKPYHFSSTVVDEILSSLDKQSGTSFYSHSHRISINRGELILSVLSNLKDQNEYFLEKGDTAVIVSGLQIVCSYTKAKTITADQHKVFVDADQLVFPLRIRVWQSGDKFMPLGMKQHKKISDFLIDQKVPLIQKEKTLLLINGNGEIIWVIGLRQDNRYKVGLATKKVAIFELLIN